jgi:predicted TIM-barrel fold metal-dependent hydrolase
MELARRHRRVLFGASIHPYRKDAVAELERCIRAGAVLLKWLPITQDMNPADERCFPLYEALAHYRLPLLAHTGGEKTLPILDIALADPMLLVPALKRGVTVIAAHCGTRSWHGETDYSPAFIRLAKEYEHLYGDTAALNLPTRSYVYETILNDPVVRQKLVHGSDWPIMPFPPVARLGWTKSSYLLAETNWLRRDVRIKEMLGFDDAYWQRAAKVLRIRNEPDARRTPT